MHAEWSQKQYHQPADVVSDSWDLSGAREDMKVYFAIGYRIAQAAAFPEWKPGTEFKAIRETMLQGR